MLLFFFIAKRFNPLSNHVVVLYPREKLFENSVTIGGNAQVASIFPSLLNAFYSF